MSIFDLGDFNIVSEETKTSESDTVEDSVEESTGINEESSRDFPGVLFNFMSPSSNGAGGSLGIANYLNGAYEPPPIVGKNEFNFTSEGIKEAFKEKVDQTIEEAPPAPLLDAGELGTQGGSSNNIPPNEPPPDEADISISSENTTEDNEEELPEDLNTQTISQSVQNQAQYSPSPSSRNPELDLQLPALIKETSSGAYDIKERDKPFIMAILSQNISTKGFPQSTTLIIRRLTGTEFREVNYEIYRKDLFISNDFELIDTITASAVRGDKRFKNLIQRRFPRTRFTDVFTYTDQTILRDRSYLYKIRLNFSTQNDEPSSKSQPGLSVSVEF